ncbi:MAG: helix-turn-helix transcriptional regulator [Caulobacterales bacterium]
MRPTQNAGARIREARLKMGWSQMQLAEKLAVSQPAVAHWESGVHAPRWALLPRIAELLGIRREDLTGRADTAAPKRARFVTLLSSPTWISDLGACGVDLPNSVSFVELSSVASSPVEIKLENLAQPACFGSARPMDLVGRAPQGHGNLCYVEGNGRTRRS